MRVLPGFVTVLIMVPLLIVLLDLRSSSLRSAYHRAVRAARMNDVAGPVISEADLARLPRQVQTYLRRAGVVGKPRVRNFHAVFTADMRAGPDDPWMHARADQYEFFQPAARFFFMKATRRGVPFDVFHRYVGGEATMQVCVAGLIPVTNMAGSEMTQSETVTLFNDMCVLAPATLVDAAVTWAALDDHTVRGTFANAGHTVNAVLTFDASGDLVDFRSDDRSRAEGSTMRRLPWTTPVRDYHEFAGNRLAARAEARWMDGSRTWAYGRFVLEHIEYNVTGPQRMEIASTHR